MSADGNAAVEIDASETSGNVLISSWAGTLNEQINSVVNSGINSVNVVAVTLIPTRIDVAANGSAAITSPLTTDDFPTSGPSPLVAAVIDASTGAGEAVQTITIYDPLPDTTGLSALSLP
jgi:hypothetical protein